MHFNAHLQCKWVSSNSSLSAEQNLKVSTTKSFSRLNRWSAVLPASAFADELWGREGWDTGPQACCFGWGEKLATGRSFSQIKFPAYVQLPGKMNSVAHFRRRIKCAASGTTTEAFIVSTVINCKPVDISAEQELGTSAHISPCGPRPLPCSLPQAGSSQVLPMVFQLVSFGTSLILFHDGCGKKSWLTFHWVLCTITHLQQI